MYVMLFWVVLSNSCAVSGNVPLLITEMAIYFTVSTD